MKMDPFTSCRAIKSASVHPHRMKTGGSFLAGWKAGRLPPIDLAGISDAKN
jgi:hypothetical protein